jgi:transcriptional regulator with XRE-family HTH domain
MSYTIASERSGLSRTTWASLESGRRNDRKQVRPRYETVVNAAKAVGVDPARALELAGHDSSAYEPSRPGRPVASVSEGRDLLAQMPESTRGLFIGLMQVFVERGLTAEPFREGVTLSEPD